MEQTKHTVVLSGVTALRALRRERRISSQITWGPVELNEQIDAMRRATCPVSYTHLPIQTPRHTRTLHRTPRAKAVTGSSEALESATA